MISLCGGGALGQGEDGMTGEVWSVGTVRGELVADGGAGRGGIIGVVRVKCKRGGGGRRLVGR